MSKKHRVDGISLSIVILNILIVIVLIVLVVLIYLYMTGKLEPTDVANMDQNGTVAQITTTKVTTGEAIEMEDPDATAETDAEETDPDAEDTTDETEEEPDIDEPVAVDPYDLEFFDADLFIGDSIYTGLVNYGFFEQKNVFAQVGLNPESANTKEYGGIEGGGNEAETHLYHARLQRPRVYGQHPHGRTDAHTRAVPA